MSDFDKKGKICVELSYELIEDFDDTMIELSHPDFDGSLYLTVPSIAKASQKIGEIEHISFFSRGFLEEGVEEDPDPEPKVVNKVSAPKEIVQINVDEDTRELGREIVRENRNVLDSFVGTLAGLFNTTREVRALIKDVKESKQ